VTLADEDNVTDEVYQVVVWATSVAGTPYAFGSSEHPRFGTSPEDALGKQ